MSEAVVFEGFWTDYTRGRVLGATITLSADRGRLFIAFLALFVRMAGGQLWQLICFIVYQARARRVRGNGLYHQQQARLRNSTSPLSAALEQMRLGLAWRKIAKNAHRRWTWLFFVAASYAAAFTVAGLFSSRLATTPALVLVSGLCGDLTPIDDYVNSDTLPTYEYLRLLEAANIEKLRQVATGKPYVDTCYTQETNTAQCQRYAAPRIGAFNTSTTPCPYLDDICIGDAMVVDTGYIHTSRDLGVNAPEEEALLYRRTSTCAVLKQKGYVSDWLTTPIDEYPLYNPLGSQEEYMPEEASKYYYYGVLVDNGHNYTYRYSNFSNWHPVQPYVVWTFSWELGLPFSPINALNHTGGDITLTMIENHALYSGWNTDPLFQATRNVTSLISSDFQDLDESFAADTEVGILACSEKAQVCNPAKKDETGSPLCSDLTGKLAMPRSHAINGVEQPNEAASPLSLSQRQLATLRRLWPDLVNDMIIIAPVNLGQDSLNASSLLVASNKLQSAELPDNQWQIEVLYWHQISLATLQDAVVAWAVGPNLQRNVFYASPAQDNTTLYADMCRNQKARSTLHTDFSALGTFLVLCLGCLIIALNLCLPSVTRRWRRRHGHVNDADLGWQMDGTLQLQRLAFENAGLGTWKAPADDKGNPSSIPTTLTGEQIPKLHHFVGSPQQRRYTSDSSGDESIKLRPYHTGVASMSGARSSLDVSEDIPSPEGSNKPMLHPTVTDGYG